MSMFTSIEVQHEHVGASLSDTPLAVSVTSVMRPRATRVQLEVRLASGSAFGQVKMNNHSSFGVRRLVAAMARASARKRRQVSALHIGVVMCRLLHASRASLTPTSNYTRELQQPLPGCASLLLLYPGVRFAHPG